MNNHPIAFVATDAKHESEARRRWHPVPRKSRLVKAVVIVILACLLAVIVLLPMDAYNQVAHRRAIKGNALETALAIEKYRTEHGHYPQKELVMGTAAMQRRHEVPTLLKDRSVDLIAGNRLTEYQADHNGFYLAVENEESRLGGVFNTNWLGAEPSEKYGFHFFRYDNSVSLWRRLTLQR